MAYMAGGEAGRKGRMWERNTQPQGRSGGKVPILSGPAKNPKHNPTKSGGINRPTRGV